MAQNINNHALFDICFSLMFYLSGNQLPKLYHELEDLTFFFGAISSESAAMKFKQLIFGFPINIILSISIALVSSSPATQSRKKINNKKYILIDCFI